MPTGSLRHKEYLSDKIHNTLSFSFLKCLQFLQLVPRLWLDHTNMRVQRGVWQTLHEAWAGDSSSLLAARDPARKLVFPGDAEQLEEQQAAMTHSSIRVSREAAARCFNIQSRKREVEEASQGTGIFLQCNTDCIDKLSISSSIQKIDQACQEILSDMTPTLQSKTEHRLDSNV